MSDTDPTLADDSCPSTDELREFIAGQLGTQRTDEVAAHIEQCSACEAALETLDNAEVSIDAVVAPGGDLQFADEPHCGRAVDAAARDSSAGGGQAVAGAPQQVGEFELLGPLGEGGMGTVYRARHASLGTTYAVKLLHPRRQADLATIERFQREMVALGRLDHPNIVRAVDAGEENGVHYLVMEYIEGVDLGRALQARGPMSIANACEAARQAAQGLAYVHQHKRVHRDVKPSNLMVASDGTVKLLDLGLARVEEYALDEPQGATDDILGGGSTVELTRTHQVMGTLEYMSPEQASNSKTVDEKADLYSLGCTLYKLLTGRSPFASDQSVTAMSQLLAHVEKPAPPVREHRPDIPDGLAKLLDHLLAKDPAERPASADEVAGALAPFAAGSDLSALAQLDHPKAERDAGDGSSKTVVLPRSDDRIERKRSKLPWGPILLAAAGLCVLLVCPVGLAIMAFWFRPADRVQYAAVPTQGAQQVVPAMPDPRAIDPDLVGEPVDLLASLDPQRDIRGNDWQVVNGALISDPATASMLQFAYRPPDHYRWEATVERLQSEESLEIGLVAGNHPLILLVDGYPGAGPYSGIYRLDNRNVTQHRSQIHRGQVLPFGRPVRLAAWVTHQSGNVNVRLEADGREVFTWQGRSSRSRATGNFTPTQPGVLFLGNWTAALRVSDVQVTPLNGVGEAIEFVDSVENINLAAAQRALWKGGVVTVADGADVREVTTLGDLTSQSRVLEINMQGSEWLNDQDLLYFASLGELTRLNLSGTAVSNEGLRLLGPLPALVDLSLADTGVSRDHPGLASDYPSLERLNLAATGIGTETIAALNELNGLTSLDVSATRVTDDALAHLSGLERLRLLHLNHTAVSDAGLEQIPALPGLEQLSLSGTRVLSATAITNEKFPNLARLDLLETGVSTDAATRIRESLPGVEVSTGTEATNLLALIDPQRDGYAGHWESASDGESLRVPSHNPARLAIPVTLPEEFDLEVVAVNNEEGTGHGPVFGLPLPNGGRPLVGFDHWPGRSDGPWTILHGIDGQMERDSPAKVSRDIFTDGTPVKLTIRVRNDGVTVEREDEVLLAWQGDVSQLAAGTAWFTGDLIRPTIGLYNTDYTIPKMTLTPVTGRIGLPSFRPTHGDSDRSVAEWMLARGGSVHVRYSDDDDSEPRFQAGQSLPERPFWVTRIAGPEGLHIPGEWLRDVGTLHHLEQIQMPHATFENADLAPLGGVKTLQLTGFEGSLLNDEGLAVLAQLPNLKTLWIGNTAVTSAGFSHFRDHPALEVIGAAGPALTDEVFEIAATIPSLVQLSLWRSSVTGEGLVHLQGHESLRRLYLGRSDAGPVQVDHLAGIPRLATFHCAQNGLGPEAAEQLAQLRQLSVLRVHQNPLGDDGILHLAMLEGLTELNFAGVGATDAAPEALRKLRNLRELDISENPGISDASVPALIAVRTLRQLSLGGTGITPAGIRQLRNGLPQCQIITGDPPSTSGRTINLSQRGVTDETLPLALEGVPPTTLILEGQGITDASMPLVASLPGLQRLQLHGTRVTNDGLAHLADAHTLARFEMWDMPQITAPAVEHIAAIPRLTRVVLKSTGIYGPGLEHLHGKGLLGFYIGNPQLDRAMLEQYVLPFGTLNELDLAGSAITDEDLALLPQVEVGRYLHLGFNRGITGPGLRHVADMPGVRLLILDASGVDDDGLRHLSGAGHLERLMLKKTAVSNASVDTIAAFPNLTDVNVTDSNFTTEGVDRLRELLPNATITAEHLETTDGYPPADSELIVEGAWKSTFSPDGSQLVYGLAQGTGLEIIDLDTRERRQLSEMGKDAAWSPRGDWIAAAREPFHNSQREEVWIIRPDGSEERKVADGLYPFWIDGGATLVFYRRGLRGLLSLDVDQSDAEPQEFHARIPSYYGDATQDGTYLAYGYQGKVEVIQRSSGQIVFERSFSGANGTGLPSFSPDGNYLAYAPFGGTERGVWIFDWRSGAEIRLNESSYQAPAWSPDGTRLSFDYRAPGTDTRQTSIWMINVADRFPVTDDE